MVWINPILPFKKATNHNTKQNKIKSDKVNSWDFFLGKLLFKFIMGMQIFWIGATI